MRNFWKIRKIEDFFGKWNFCQKWIFWPFFHDFFFQMYIQCGIKMKLCQKWKKTNRQVLDTHFTRLFQQFLRFYDECARFWTQNTVKKSPFFNFIYKSFRVSLSAYFLPCPLCLTFACTCTTKVSVVYLMHCASESCGGDADSFRLFLLLNCIHNDRLQMR